MSDGTVRRAALAITVPHPMYRIGPRYPVRVTIDLSRAVRVERRAAPMCAIPERVPLGAGAELLHLDFAPRAPTP